MTSILYGPAGFAFVGWKQAKDQLREMLERKGVKVHHVRDLPVSFGGTRLEAYIDMPGWFENASDFIASLESSRAGVNISVTICTGLPPDEQPQVPAPWYESLTVTEPQTEIYGARAGLGAQVYFSEGPDKAPSFDQTELTTTGQLRTVLFGKSVKVWRTPVPGSGWICVHIFSTNRALWVRGEDMRATP